MFNCGASLFSDIEKNTRKLKVKKIIKKNSKLTVIVKLMWEELYSFPLLVSISYACIFCHSQKINKSYQKIKNKKEKQKIQNACSQEYKMQCMQNK